MLHASYGNAVLSPKGSVNVTGIFLLERREGLWGQSSGEEGVCWGEDPPVATSFVEGSCVSGSAQVAAVVIAVTGRNGQSSVMENSC